MDANRSSGHDQESAEYEDMFICSRCGFSRSSIETVIEHLEAAHGGHGQVREYKREIEQKGHLRLVFEWFYEILERYSF